MLTRSAFAFLMASVCLPHQNAYAQFSNPVVVMKGCVMERDSGFPVSAVVSVRSFKDTSYEVTRSRSNSATGEYLVVLKPGEPYWIHIEGDSICVADLILLMPQSDRSIEFKQDFLLNVRRSKPQLQHSLLLNGQIETRSYFPFPLLMLRRDS